MTGTLRLPRFNMACSDGKIFLYARSPVAPKKTKASELDTFMVSSSRRFLLKVSAEPVPHRRQNLVLIVGFPSRTESFIESGREYRHRYGLIDGSLDRPPAFAGVRDPAGKFREFGIL